MWPHGHPDRQTDSHTHTNKPLVKAKLLEKDLVVEVAVVGVIVVVVGAAARAAVAAEAVVVIVVGKKKEVAAGA